MLKIQILSIVLWSLTHAVYISRMSTPNRLRSPTPFRPGLSMQRPWVQSQTRVVQAASHRAPYVVYRNPPRRYAVKHFNPSATRTMFATGPWKTTVRLPPPAPSSSEYEFVKAASAPAMALSDGGTGAIHTIPAPNLSLSEKPIVVIDTSDSAVSEQPKPSYEVTEKHQEPELTMAKIERPIGFSKATTLTTPELQTLISNGAALQIAAEFGLPINAQQPQVIQQSYPIQALNIRPTQQDLNTRAQGIFIPPNALYQSDPMFLQKLQNQLLQRFSAVEFIPYPADTAPQEQDQMHLQPQASENHPQVIIVDDQINTHRQATEKNVSQREAQEAAFTIIPQAFVAPNRTVEETTPQPHNLTLDTIAPEPQPVTTTIKYVVESNTEEQKTTTPIYYAQIGQSVGSVVANGFYSAINDVRAAAALEQVENPPAKKVETENITTTTMLVPAVGTYFVNAEEKRDNQTDLKSMLGVPFKNPEESVNIAYTLLRTDDKEPKVTQEGVVYAGQIVEATVSEDHDYNKEKATLISRRAPIRLIAAVESKESNVKSVTTTSLPQVKVIKAKIPPKTKLTFDDKTGEPILRIYASYVDNPVQKDAVVAKLTTIKHINEVKDPVDDWKMASVKSASKDDSFDVNKVTQFGLKLRSRSDDYIPLFEDYDD